MEVVRFTMSSAFGFFQWGKTRGDRRFSNLFISRTEVLGILGAIIGVEGYATSQFKKAMNVEGTDPLFYEVLGGLDIAVIPNQEPSFFEDHLIHRHMMWVNANGPLQVQMTGLVNPSYTVLVGKGTCEDHVYEMVRTYLLNGWATYIPYFGKNQFPIEVEQAGTLRLQQEEGGVILHSLFPADRAVYQAPPRRAKMRSGEEFHYSDRLKNFKEVGSSEIVGVETLWSSREVEMQNGHFRDDTGKAIVFL